MGGRSDAAAPNGGLPAYFPYGAESEPPPNAATLCIADRWYGPGRDVKRETAFPAISFGASTVTAYTSTASPLGRLLGGNAYGDFSLLGVRGAYATALMHATVRDDR